MTDLVGAAFDPANATGLFGGDDGSDAAAAANAGLDSAIQELRRQFGITQENIAPFLEAGRGALPGLVEGSTAEGLDERLRRLFDTDIFGGLVDERTRAVEGQLAAGGLTRSGAGLQEIANVPTGLGLQLEQLLTGRLGNLAGSGQNAALGLGSLGQANAGAIANLFGQQGANTASGILTDAQAGAAQQQNLIQAGATAASIFFSDPSLKTNIEPVAFIGDLPLYQWDWIPEAKGTIIEKCGTIGFMADEVKEKYPEFVGEYGGFMVIDYPALLDKLEAA